MTLRRRAAENNKTNAESLTSPLRYIASSSWTSYGKTAMNIIPNICFVFLYTVFTIFIFMMYNTLVNVYRYLDFIGHFKHENNITSIISIFCTHGNNFKANVTAILFFKIKSYVSSHFPWHLYGKLGNANASLVTGYNIIFLFPHRIMSIIYTIKSIMANSNSSNIKFFV